MNFLDVRTVIFSHLVTNVLCALAIVSLWQQSRKRFAGTAWWVLDFAFQATASSLIVLRGSIPDWMSIVLANTLVIAGALAFYIGLGHFTEKTSSQVHNYLLLAAFAGAHTYFTFVQPSLAARNLNVSLGLLIVCFQCVWLIGRRVRPDLRRMMLRVGLVFGAFCLISLVRIVVIFASPQPGNDFFQSGVFDTLVLLLYQILPILLAYSLILIVNGRLLVAIQAQEETLRESEERYRQAQKIGHIGNWEFNLMTNTFWGSEEAKRLYGFDPQLDDFSTDEVEECIPERERVHQALIDLIQAGKPYNLEFEIKPRNTTQSRIISSLAELQKDKYGRPQKVIGVIQDITDRKQAEAALRALSSRQQALLMAIPDIIVEVDKNKVFTWTNPAGLEFYGEDVLGKEAAFYFEGEQDTYSIVAPLFGGSEDVTYVESWQRRKDGEKRLLAWWCRVLKDGGGNVIGALSTARDITERRQAELELVSAQEKLKEAHCLAHIGTWDWVIENDTVTWSEELCHIAGWDPSLPAPTYAELSRCYTPASWDRLSGAVTRALTTGEPYNLELELIRPDGSLRWTHAFGGVKRDGAGKVIGLHGTVQDITARKRAEAALRETNAYLENLINYANAPIIVWDPHFRITRFNHAFEFLTGRTEAEVLGQSLDILFPPALAENSMALIRKTLTGERWETVEIKILHRDESVQTVLWNSATLFAPDGQTPIATIAQGHDITERKHAEAALRESEEMFRNLAENAYDGILIATGQGVHQYANERAAEITGYSVAELLTITMKDLAHPAEIKKVAERLRKRLARETIESQYETVIVRKGGQTIPIEVTGAATVWRGQPSTIVIFRDITNRKQAEAALKHSEAHYHLLADHMTDIIWLIDTNLKLTYISPSGEKIRGYTLAELQQLPLDQTLTPASFQAAMAVFEAEVPKVLADPGYSPVFTLELEFYRRDGRLHSVESKLSIIRDEQGKPTSILGQDRDITDRKRAESQREAALAALRESHIELQTRHEELNAFAHTVAHDLKNPLSVMMSYAELLAEDYSVLTADKAQQALMVISRSGQKAANIIDSLLMLASVRQQDVQAAPLDMARIIEEALLRLADPIRDSGADIRMPDRASWPVALGHALWIEEIWVNYLSNALKYGGPQPRIDLGAARLPPLSATARERAQGGGFIRFSVRDYGAGLTPEQQERLFVPFERLGQMQVEGHGLGLSVVRRIADKLGGQAGVDSQPGHGSTFYFTLPAILDSEF